MNFNFSQLIRDNVEEALSGVKGANSVKLFGHRPGDPGRGRPAGREHPRRRSAGSRTSASSTSSASRTWRSRSTATVAPGTGSTWPTSRRSCRSRSAAGRSRRWSRGRSSTTSSCGSRSTSATTPTSSAGSRSTPPPRPTASPGVRIPLAQVATIVPHKPGASYVYRENNRRFIPIKFSVRNRDLASAIAEAQQKVDDPKDGRQPAAGLPGRVVGRVRPDAGGQRAADADHPALDRADHDPAVHGVQLDEGRDAGHGQRRRRDDGGRLGPVDHRRPRSASRRPSGSSRSSASPSRTACS